MENKKYKLVEVTPEELEAFNQDLQGIIQKHGVDFRAVPVYMPQPLSADGKPQGFTTEAQVLINKKVEIIEEPAKEGVPSPFVAQPNGEQPESPASETPGEAA